MIKYHANFQKENSSVQAEYFYGHTSFEIDGFVVSVIVKITTDMEGRNEVDRVEFSYTETDPGTLTLDKVEDVVLKNSYFNKESWIL